MKQYGLIGKNISYSFSRRYFAEKFAAENILGCEYLNFDLEAISKFPELIRDNPSLKGLNVTIPYKETVIPYLDKLDKNAAKIGAVNTIKIHRDGKLEGFNTDEYGFRKSIMPMLNLNHQKALILGTGGASKAVAFALEILGIPFQFVSRMNDKNVMRYEDLPAVFGDYQIIINTTPLGTFPDIDNCPDLPYAAFTANHIAYDLIYNPAETLFLEKAKSFGAVTKNGLEMLQFQAEKSWEIWNR